MAQTTQAQNTTPAASMIHSTEPGGFSKKALVWISVVIVVIAIVWIMIANHKSNPSLPSTERIALNYVGLPCEANVPEESSILPDRNIVQSITLNGGGCYLGNYTFPKKVAGGKVWRDHAPGDWASMWCTDRGGGQARMNPNPIHTGMEDFGNDFENCQSFALQGKGTFYFKILTHKY